MGCDLFVDASTLGAGFVMDAFRGVSRALRRKIFSGPLGRLCLSLFLIHVEVIQIKFFLIVLECLMMRCIRQ